MDKRIVNVYVDESGSITKTNVSNNRYFVIAMLFTENPEKIRKLFKKKISQLMKHDKKYETTIMLKKEIKGSDISETTKRTVYEHILRNAAEELELGIIVLDNYYIDDRFINNHAKTINYMIQVYLNDYFRKYSKFMSGKGRIEFIIDEQNIATGEKYGLKEYLNQQLTLDNAICDMFNVKYTDSKNEKLVQLADFIANTFYRNIEKKNKESIDTVGMWKPILCYGKVYDFLGTYGK